MAAVTPTAVTELLSPDQGEIIVKPRPEPRSSRIKVTPVAATAPPIMGPQDIAVLDDSIGITPELSERDIAIPILQKWRGE
jgi:hypothetical protein